MRKKRKVAVFRQRAKKAPFLALSPCSFEDWLGSGAAVSSGLRQSGRCSQYVPINNVFLEIFLRSSEIHAIIFNWSDRARFSDNLQGEETGERTTVTLEPQCDTGRRLFLIESAITH